MKHVKNIKNLKGKRVIVRAELNVPVKGGVVLDDFRIEKTAETIQWLKKKGARVVVIGHIGRKGTETLKLVAAHMKKYTDVGFVPDIHGPRVEEMIHEMKEGSALMLENLRQDDGEEKNKKAFAKKLATLGDIYVNDAFSVAHRKHASIVGLPKLLPAYAGFLMDTEVRELSRVLKPKHPFLFILGGAKIHTKLPLIKAYLQVADHVFVGGALAHNFFKALGFEIGTSKYEYIKAPIKTLLQNDALLLPVDVVAKRGKGDITRPSGEVQKNEKIVDAGPESVAELAPYIARAKLIVFNGPLGYYEGGYSKATRDVLKKMANSKATTIVGGGDTARLITEARMHNKFTFASTGGGAMIQFLTDGTLPGIEALEK